MYRCIHTHVQNTGKTLGNNGPGLINKETADGCKSWREGCFIVPGTAPSSRFTHATTPDCIVNLLLTKRQALQ